MSIIYPITGDESKKEFSLEEVFSDPNAFQYLTDSAGELVYLGVLHGGQEIASTFYKVDSYGICLEPQEMPTQVDEDFQSKGIEEKLFWLKSAIALERYGEAMQKSPERILILDGVSEDNAQNYYEWLREKMGFFLGVVASSDESPDDRVFSKTNQDESVWKLEFLIQAVRALENYVANPKNVDPAVMSYLYTRIYAGK